MILRPSRTVRRDCGVTVLVVTGGLLLGATLLRWAVDRGIVAILVLLVIVSLLRLRDSIQVDRGGIEERSWLGLRRHHTRRGDIRRVELERRRSRTHLVVRLRTGGYRRLIVLEAGRSSSEQERIGRQVDEIRQALGITPVATSAAAE